MTAFITKQPGQIILMTRAEGEGKVGDLVREVRPGESELGKTYEEWAAIETPSVAI